MLVCTMSGALDGVGLIPQIARIRALLCVVTASAFGLSHSHAGWRVVFDSRVQLPKQFT